MSSLTNKGKQQILRQQIHAKFPYLVTIDWQDGTVSRFINADEDTEFEGEVYSAYSFSIQKPQATDKGYSTGKFSFSRINDNTNIIGKVRETEVRPVVEVVGAIIYKDGLIDEIESIFDVKYYLANPSWGDDTDVVWDLKVDEGLDIQMPCDTLNGKTCPALV